MEYRGYDLGVDGTGARIWQSKLQRKCDLEQ
jgi:hypothetical protein